MKSQHVLVLASSLLWWLAPGLAEPPADSPAVAPSIPPPASAPSSPATSGPAPVEIQLGSAHVPIEHGVILRSQVPAAEELRSILVPLVRSLAPGALTTGPDIPGSPLEIELHWCTPPGSTRVTPLQDGQFRVGPLPGGIHEFFLLVKDPAIGYELRIPESPRTFQLETAAASPQIEIIEGTGSIARSFGEQIPIWLKVRGVGHVRKVTLYFRTREQVAESPMELELQENDTGTYQAKIPHPMAAGAILDYWITLEDVQGRKTEYGAPESPNRLRSDTTLGPGP